MRMFIIMASFWDRELNGYTGGFYQGLYCVEAHNKREALDKVQREHFEEVKDAEGFTIFEEVSIL